MDILLLFNVRRLCVQAHVPREPLGTIGRAELSRPIWPLVYMICDSHLTHRDSRWFLPLPRYVFTVARRLRVTKNPVGKWENHDSIWPTNSIGTKDAFLHSHV